tara:strand:- start:194 stop:409 length:216 start_codon:yes stop_codon:yes gene_type:complete
MNINPAVTAYTSLNITDDDVNKKPKKSSTGIGLLSRKREADPKEKSNEPIDRVRDYVISIRKKRKQLTNGQ